MSTIIVYCQHFSPKDNSLIEKYYNELVSIIHDKFDVKTEINLRKDLERITCLLNKYPKFMDKNIELTYNEVSQLFDNCFNNELWYRINAISFKNNKSLKLVTNVCNEIELERIITNHCSKGNYVVINAYLSDFENIPSDDVNIIIDTKLDYVEYISNIEQQLDKILQMLATEPEPEQPVVEDVSIKTQLLTTVETEATTVSSQRKGVLGEDTLVELLQTINPKFDVQKVSNSPHIGDIHVFDYDHNLLFVVESKFKKTITRDDVIKFEKDVSNVKSQIEDFKVIGLFMSLTSKHIPGIGCYSISPELIYLTEDFVNKDTLTVMFDMLNINEIINVSNKPVQQSVKYEIPSNVIDLIIKLRSEYVHIVNERSIYQNILDNAQQTTNDINTLFHRLIIKEEFIKLIDNEFKSALPNETVTVSITDTEEERLRQYLKTNKKTSKKAIIDEFPLLNAKLSKMLKDDIIKAYS